MALDPSRRRRNLPTGDFKPDFESPPGYQQYLLITQTSLLSKEIEYASGLWRRSAGRRLGTPTRGDGVRVRGAGAGTAGVAVAQVNNLRPCVLSGLKCFRSSV